MKCLKEKRRTLKMPFRFKIGIFFICIILVVIFILIFLNNVVNPVIISTMAAKTRKLSQQAVESAIFETINDTLVYDTLITITRDENGDVVLISTNSLQINLLARELVNIAQQKLEQIGEQGVHIPVGSLTGLPIFVGKGPEIKIKMLPIGNITCKFTSEFKSAGINQTNHKLYLTVNSNVSVILPIENQIIQTQTQIMIAESIIVGKIPETYLNSSSVDEMLNLIP